MPDATMTFGGDASKLYAEYQKLLSAERDWQRETRKTQADAKRREQEMIEGLRKTEQETKNLEQSGTRAFVAIAAKATAAIASVRTMIGVLSEADRVAKEAAGRAKTSGEALGELAQLAGGDAAKLTRMIGGAQDLRRSGVVGSMKEAAGLQFQFESAGVDAAGRQAISGLRKFNVIGEADEFTKSLVAMQQAMGRGETGDLQQMISKGFAAAGPTPGKFQELLMASASAAPTAKMAGVSDEALLASVGVVTKATGRPDEAATMMNAFFKAMNERGLQGRSIQETVKDIQAKNMTPGQLQEFFGRQEGLKAYQILAGNMGEYGKLEQDIYGATNANLGGQAVATAAANPLIGASVAAKIAEGKQDLMTTDLGVTRLLAESRIKEQEDGTWWGAAKRMGADVGMWLGLDPDKVARYAGDFWGTSSRSQQEAAARTGAAMPAPGAVVTAPDRPYTEKKFPLPQQTESEDPVMVALRAEMAPLIQQRLARKGELVEEFSRNDGVVSRSESNRIERDKTMMRLATAIEKLEIQLGKREQERRLNAGSNMAAPPN